MNNTTLLWFMSLVMRDSKSSEGSATSMTAFDALAGGRSVLDSGLIEGEEANLATAVVRAGASAPEMRCKSV